MSKERSNMECEKCGAKRAKYYTLVGAIFTYLCTKCRTDYHTYISSNAPVTDLYDKKIVMMHAQNDPLMFPSANADYLDAELEVHKMGLKWLRGSK